LVVAFVLYAASSVALMNRRGCAADGVGGSAAAFDVTRRLEARSPSAVRETRVT
jgi:hypothetical protein